MSSLVGHASLRLKILPLSLLVLACCRSAGAQQPAAPAPSSPDTFWARWFERSDKAKDEQPRWITPLATTTPRLEQEFRSDLLWQQPTAGAPYTENIGNGKGLELIPADNVEIIASVPPYVLHHSAVNDGFGDARFLLKYRLAAANDTHGDYIVTAFLDVSLPTGQAPNGQPKPIITPTIAYGKGAGRLDVQGTFGAALPAGDEPTIGRMYTWNNALQYRVFRRLWPEVEVNATFFQDGRNGGRKQVLVTPGLVVGKIPLTARLGLTLGAGAQFAVSTFRTTEHNFIVSVRLPF